MIKNYWYAISRSDLIRKHPLKIERFGIKMVLWRNSQGSLTCLEDRCAHRGTSLALGKVVGDCIECPYHGFQYNSQGACNRIPSNGSRAKIPDFLRIRNFEVQEAKGIVWFWWGDSRNAYPELPWFEEYKNDDPYVEASREMPISFCRGMEGNLDFGHFYFVHRAFRMPGMGPVADPFESTVTGDLIRVQGTLRHEKKPPSSGVSFEGAVLFPGLATYDAPGRAKKKDRTFVALSPIDEDRTWLLIRFYFPKGLLAPLKHFYWKFIFLKILFPMIHHQDIRVMKAQTPQSSGLHTDLLMSKADAGIAQYLALWNQALKRGQEKVS